VVQKRLERTPPARLPNHQQITNIDTVPGVVLIKRADRRQLPVDRRRHDPIPVQGQWLASVVRGHLTYYAVPGNTDTVQAFRTQVTRHWFKALRRRSQKTQVTWTRMNRIVDRWLPRVHVMHPFPAVRFAART